MPHRIIGLLKKLVRFKEKKQKMSQNAELQHWPLCLLATLEIVKQGLTKSGSLSLPNPGFKPRTMDRILAPQKCHKCGITTLAPVLVNDTSNCGFKPRTMDRILVSKPLCQGFKPEPTEYRRSSVGHQDYNGLSTMF